MTNTVSYDVFYTQNGCKSHGVSPTLFHVRLWPVLCWPYCVLPVNKAVTALPSFTQPPNRRWSMRKACEGLVLIHRYLINPCRYNIKNWRGLGSTYVDVEPTCTAKQHHVTREQQSKRRHLLCAKNSHLSKSTLKFLITPSLLCDLPHGRLGRPPWYEICH